MSETEKTILDLVNVYDESIPVERLAEILALTQAELESLWYCTPREFDILPPPGKRSAYASCRIFDLKLVKSLWCRDAAADEVFFTWQRTAPGERLLAWHIENGFVPPVPPAEVIDADELHDPEEGRL